MESNALEIYLVIDLRAGRLAVRRLTKRSSGETNWSHDGLDITVKITDKDTDSRKDAPLSFFKEPRGQRWELCDLPRDELDELQVKGYGVIPHLFNEAAATLRTILPNVLETHIGRLKRSPNNVEQVIYLVETDDECKLVTESIKDRPYDGRVLLAPTDRDYSAYALLQTPIEPLALSQVEHLVARAKLTRPTNTRGSTDDPNRRGAAVYLLFWADKLRLHRQDKLKALELRWDEATRLRDRLRATHKRISTRPVAVAG